MTSGSTRDAWLRPQSAFRLLVDAGRAWSADRAPRLGAGLAYYGLFALVPVLFLALSIAGLILGSDAAEQQVEEQLEGLLGDELAGQVDSALEAVRLESSLATLPLISFGVLVFSASVLFVAWKEMVELIWGQPKEPGLRGTLRRRLFALVAIGGAGLLLVVSVFAQTVVTTVQRIVGAPVLDALVRTTGSVVSLALGAAFVGVLLRYTPDRAVPWRDVFPGAVIAMLLLSVAGWGYGVYVRTIGLSSATGVAGLVILGLLLVYYAAQILLYGVEVTKIAHHMRTGATHDIARHVVADDRDQPAVDRDEAIVHEAPEREVGDAVPHDPRLGSR